MKAKALTDYNTISTGDVGEFVEDDSWQGAYMGRKKPYGYFEFTNDSGTTKISMKLAKESPNFTITNED